MKLLKDEPRTIFDATRKASAAAGLTYWIEDDEGFTEKLAACIQNPRIDGDDLRRDFDRKCGAWSKSALRHLVDQDTYLDAGGKLQGDLFSEEQFILSPAVLERLARLASMRFGPVNSDGGERRLNVLFSRARVRCEVFTSFDPADIDLSRSKTNGVRVFKRFLDYAKTGELQEKAPTGMAPDSKLEIDIAREIRAMGFEVDYQVGTAGFRIDLGIRDREKPPKISGN